MMVKLYNYEIQKFFPISYPISFCKEHIELIAKQMHYVLP